MDEVENFDEEDNDENVLKRKIKLEDDSMAGKSKKQKDVVETKLEDFDEGPGILWNISKVIPYKPGPVPGKQRFVAENGDPKVRILEDGVTLENLGGYRSARAAYGISEGAAYFEVKVPVVRTGAVRLGWSIERGDPEATVGYDKWGYGMRDLDGSKFHESRGKSYGPAFRAGDLMGAYIYLPPKPDDEPEPRIPEGDPNKESPDIVFENEELWCIRVLPDVSYNLPTSEVIPVPRKGSFIMFFRNGEPLGIAFRDIYSGTYYPSVSPYKTKVKANFGPEFEYKPKLPKDVPPCVSASKLYDIWLPKYQEEERKKKIEMEQQKLLEAELEKQLSQIENDSNNQSTLTTTPAALPPPVPLSTNKMTIGDE